MLAEMDENLPRLTEAQREVLRLLFARLRPGQIARQLDISENAVNERLRNARRTLGVGTSLEAASMLAKAEGADPYKPLVADVSVVEPSPNRGFSVVTRLPWPWASEGRHEHDRTLGSTIFGIQAATIIMVIVAAGYLGAIAILSGN